ncbi:MAG: hypothetical protein ACHQAQ_03345 [Hyphomicrobiales bacterium]
MLSPGVTRNLRTGFAAEAAALVDRLLEQRCFDAIPDLAEAPAPCGFGA